MVSRAEHSEALSAMRALRAENARLEAKVEKLESEKMLAAIRAPAPKPIAAKPSAQSSVDALPPLAVVKLKPKREAPPKLDTRVQVNEPEENVELYTDQNNPLTKSSSPSQPANTEPDEADVAMADAQFERGLDMMKTGNAEAGIAQMQQFVSDWPRHPKADNALYFAGLAHVADKDFEKASGLFERVLAQYPAGDAVLDSMLKLADCRQKMNKPREARATWEKIVSNYPGTAAATQAQARLASARSPSVATP